MGYRARINFRGVSLRWSRLSRGTSIDLKKMTNIARVVLRTGSQDQKTAFGGLPKPVIFGNWKEFGNWKIHRNYHVFTSKSTIDRFYIIYIPAPSKKTRFFENHNLSANMWKPLPRNAIAGKHVFFSCYRLQSKHHTGWIRPALVHTS
jgi:hypothetical protein